MRTSKIERPTSNIELKECRGSICFDLRCSTFNVRRSHFLFFLLTFLPSAFAATPATHPTTRAVTQPTAVNLQLHECTVFVLDAATGQLNPDGIVTATLPAFVIDHRFGSASGPATPDPGQNNGNGNIRRIGRRMILNDDDATPTPAAQPIVTNFDEPSPVGIIRLTGSADTKVDVSLSAKGGAFAGAWPKAEDRPNALLWRDLTVADQPLTPASAVEPHTWFGRLREEKANWLSLGHAPGEKFLLYDLQMKYVSPLKIKAGKDDAVTISNSGKFPLHDVVLYRDGKQVEAGELPAKSAPAVNKSSTKPLNKSATQSTTNPTTAIAATSPADKSVATLTLTAHPTTQPGIPTAPWLARMHAAAVDDADALSVERLLIHYAYDKRLTAVYALDDAEIEQLVPMEVVPQPGNVSRFVLMIVINADPAAGSVVDDLIKDLGDDDWPKRDAAYHALAAMGPAATSRLQTASKGKDLEIAWRAERLLVMNPPAAKP